MKVEKKEICNIREFADLFLARYAIKYADEEENVFFQLEFKNNLCEVMEQNNDGVSFSKYGLYDDTNAFEIQKFMRYLSHSQIKFAWADTFDYDWEQNRLFTKISIKRAKEFNDKFYASAISKVDKIIEDTLALNDKNKKLMLK